MCVGVEGEGEGEERERERERERESVCCVGSVFVIGKLLLNVLFFSVAM